MIYKLWYDLFSFPGAVQLSLRYAGIILLILIIELAFKSKNRQPTSLNRDPVKGRALPTFMAVPSLGLALTYVFLAFVLPVWQIALWSFRYFSHSHFRETLESAFMTLAMGLAVGLAVVLFSVTLQLFLRRKNAHSSSWLVFSTVGYSIPGSILAVAAYALLLYFFSEVGYWLLLLGLFVALCYKFLTVGMRPIGESVNRLPRDLIETSDVLDVSFYRRVRTFLYPYLREPCVIGLLLVLIEVMKEMPLTLMLAPGGFQTLSIRIFNYTSEGEWEKAALPSLLLVVVGIISVLLVNLRRSES